MFVYKIDVIKALKEAGYSPNRIRNEKIISEASMTNIRAGKVIGIKTLDTICGILKKQPNSIIKWVPDEE